MLLDPVADGTCMCNAFILHKFGEAYCSPRGIDDGYSLRLHIIKETRDRHYDAYVKLVR